MADPSLWRERSQRAAASSARRSRLPRASARRPARSPAVPAPEPHQAVYRPLRIALVQLDPRGPLAAQPEPQHAPPLVGVYLGRRDGACSADAGHDSLSVHSSALRESEASVAPTTRRASRSSHQITPPWTLSPSIRAFI